MFLPMLGAPCTYALLPGGSDVSGRGNGSQLERKKWNDDHVPHDAPDRDSKADGMLLWMSSESKSLLCGLAGGAQHSADGGPGDVVLAGTEDG